MRQLTKLATKIERGLMEQRIFSSELESLIVVLSHIFAWKDDETQITLLLIHSSDARILRWMMRLHLLPKATIFIIDNSGDIQRFLENEEYTNQRIFIQKSLYVRFYTCISMCKGCNLRVV